MKRRDGKDPSGWMLYTDRAVSIILLTSTICDESANRWQHVTVGDGCGGGRGFYDFTRVGWGWSTVNDNMT